VSIFDDEMVQGRRAIMEFLGVKSWRTVRRWKKTYRLDKLIMKLANGRPFLLRCEIKQWLLLFNKILQETKQKEDQK
jgi:hypothetical protein